MGLNVESFGVSESGWDEALEGLHSDIYHDRRYLRADDALGSNQSILFYIRGDGHRMAIPLRLSPVPKRGAHFDASSPYGYPGPLVSVAADPDWIRDAFKLLASHLNEMNVVSLFVRFNSLLNNAHQEFHPIGNTVTHGETVVIRLSEPFEDIFASFRSNHRRGIRRSLRDGHAVVWDQAWANLGAFVSAYHETMSRVGATDDYYFPESYFHALRDDLTDRVHLWTVVIDGEFAAGAIITETNGIVQYHLGATKNEYLRAHPVKILFSEVTKWAKERGNSIFHLGGGLGGSADSLFHFKAGFSGTRVPFLTGRSVIDFHMYQTLVAEWKEENPTMVQAESDFFPLYRKS